jgi:hypothetical protein
VIGEHMPGCIDGTCSGVGVLGYDGCTRPDVPAVVDVSDLPAQEQA